MFVTLRFAPGRAGREARRLEIRRRGLQVKARSRPVALIVVGVHAARVVRVVADLVDVTHQIAAGVHGFQVTELAVDRPCRILELILVIGIVEQRDLVPLQRRTVGGAGHLVEHALGIHVLVGLCEQYIPVIVDLV